MDLSNQSGVRDMRNARTRALMITLASMLIACGDKEDPNAFKKGTTMAELKVQSAKIAARQAQEEVSRMGPPPKTELSRKARLLETAMAKSQVLRVLGAPTHVIGPTKLRSNNIDPSPEIQYVLSWTNQPCSRVEVFFDSKSRVTGWDGGEACGLGILKPLGGSYSCDSPANEKYCKL